MIHLPQSQGITNTMEKLLRETPYGYKRVVQVPHQHTTNSLILLHTSNPLVRLQMRPGDKGHGKAKELRPFFTLVFTGKTDFKLLQAPEASWKVQSIKGVLLVKENQVREHLSQLGICKPLEPNGTGSGVLTWLVSL